MKNISIDLRSDTITIPTKAMLRSAEIFHLMHRANEFGLSAEKISFDLQE